MKRQLQVMNILMTLALSHFLAAASYAETYTYDAAGRLIGVVYDGGSALSYNLDASGNLLALTTVEAAVKVSIAGGSRTIEDTNGVAGESVSLSATAADSSASFTETQWLINTTVVATGFAPTIALPDGDTTLTFKATDSAGAIATDTVTLTVLAPPLEQGWPAPYSGVTPDASLGLEFNNISALSLQDGLIYSCLRVLSNGLPSALDGIERFDIAFEIVSSAGGTLRAARAKPFNGTSALNEKGEAPDCSGSFEINTNTYEDVVQVGADVYRVKVVLIDGAGLVFQVTEASVVAPSP